MGFNLEREEQDFRLLLLPSHLEGKNDLKMNLMDAGQATWKHRQALHRRETGVLVHLKWGKRRKGSR